MQFSTIDKRKPYCSSFSNSLFQRLVTVAVLKYLTLIIIDFYTSVSPFLHDRPCLITFLNTSKFVEKKNTPLRVGFLTLFSVFGIWSNMVYRV